MGSRSRFCAVCGKPTMHSKFCSNACKMRDYRKRKKQKDEAAKITIDIDHWMIQDRLVKQFGEWMDYNLGRFFQTYGKTAYCDLLIFLSKVTYPVSYDERTAGD